ncbi:hypothetical protein Tco_1282115 [Tanacetum coccineum]
MSNGTSRIWIVPKQTALALATPEQMATSKEISNPLTTDSLLKTIREDEMLLKIKSQISSASTLVSTGRRVSIMVVLILRHPAEWCVGKRIPPLMVTTSTTQPYTCLAHAQLFILLDGKGVFHDTKSTRYRGLEVAAPKHKPPGTGARYVPRYPVL